MPTLDKKALNLYSLDNYALNKSRVDAFVLNGLTSGGGNGGIDLYTTLMLHMDGDNDGTVFADSALSPKIITPTSVLTKTAQKKIGTAAGYFSGAGSFLTIGGDVAQTGDVNRPLTIDTWIYPTAANSAMTIVLQNNNNRAGDFILLIGSTNKIALYRWTGTSTNIKAAFSSSSIAANQWTHIVGEWLADGSCKLGIGGILETITPSDSSASAGGNVVRIGENGNATQGFQGYIDEFRASDNIVRYSANFTPPTEAYSVA